MSGNIPTPDVGLVWWLTFTLNPQVIFATNKLLRFKSVSTGLSALIVGVSFDKANKAFTLKTTASTFIPD
ncbi:MAG: hypothetical protein RM347_024190 [Nostoc sp. ChiQUE02]|uniref:hypothetical protein n=1 Tax=Nostoc sp. ChiQUE02 TaxID=3075377 RepID=UPI003D1618C3